MRRPLKTSKIIEQEEDNQSNATESQRPSGSFFQNSSTDTGITEAAKGQLQLDNFSFIN